jgi:branched-chain amino acid transport system ATP-binding protein
MLEVRDLAVYYGPFPAVREAALRVEPGQLVGLVGPNGAGKTTLLRAVSGLLKPAAGRILFDGFDITGWPAERVCELGLVHVPEGRGLFPRLTVLDNLRLGAYLPRARVEMDRTLKEVFDLFPRLHERRRQLAGTLSGGEQQMLAIGRGLMARPRLLILDEPTLGLSPRLAYEILELVKRLKTERGLTLLVVSQEVLHLLNIADYAFVMETGRVTAEGPASELISDPKMRQVYVGL